MLVLTLVCLQKGYSQNLEKAEFPMMSKYKKWSFVAGPAWYDKGKTNPKYGDYTIKPLSLINYNAGIEYDYHPEKKWSLITGLYIAKEPGYNVEYYLKP